MIVRGLLLPDFDHPPDADTLRDSYLGALLGLEAGDRADAENGQPNAFSYGS
jgi:hypothetical protein